MIFTRKVYTMVYCREVCNLKMDVSSRCVVVDGFTVVPVKCNENSKSCHHFYLKDHCVRDSHPSKPQKRTLFVLNVPPYATEESIKLVFERCGLIENVYIHKKPTSALPRNEKYNFFKSVDPVRGFKVAYVVFKKEDSVKKAKSLPFDEALVLSTQKNPVKTGLRKWSEEYSDNICDVDELQKEIDKYMESYDRQATQEKQEAKKSEGIPDEEGWVTVTKHGRNKGIPRTEAHEKKVSVKEKKKTKEKELLNFYAFQIRESKREHIAELRQKFEEDKQRIAVLKSQRKFRPY